MALLPVGAAARRRQLLPHSVSWASRPVYFAACAAMHRYGNGWPPAGPEDDNTSGWQHLRNHPHTAFITRLVVIEASNQTFARDAVSLPVIRSVSL